MQKKFLLIVIITIFFLRPAILLFQTRDAFFSKGYHDLYPALKTLYYKSQYVTKKNPAIIPDETLEAFAAGAFLKGINPILIIHDQPPLGRYILSLSIFLFDNPNKILLFLLLACLLGVFLIAKKVTGNTFLSFIPVGLFANEPLFMHKFVYTPLLEPVQLPFIVFAILFFMKAVEEKKDTRWFFLTEIFIGFVISTRFFALGAALFFSLLSFLLFQKQWKKLLKFFLFFPFALLILIVSYGKTIQDGASLLHIIGIQKYMYFYHQTQLSLPFSFWDLLLFDRWHTWWGTYAIQHDSEWVIIWPISVLFIMIFLVKSMMKKVKYNKNDLIIFLWIVFYSLLLSLGNTSTRYFLPLVPFLYILAVSSTYKLSKKKKK